MINPDDFGIDPKTGIAGLFGGFFALLVMRDLTAKQAFVSIVGGLIAATYCTNLVVHLLGIPSDFAGGVGFAIGVFGLAAVGKLMMIINSLTLEDFKEITIQWIKTIIGSIIDGIKAMKGGGK